LVLLNFLCHHNPFVHCWELETETSGTVIDCGHNISQIIPVYECFSLQHAIENLPIAGKQINDHLKILLQSKLLNNSNEQSNQDSLFIDENSLLTIKTRSCFIPSDYQQILKSNPQKLQQVFKLPDERTITIDFERIMAPEILFEPNLYSSKPDSPAQHNNIQDNNDKIKGLPQLLLNSIQKCNQPLHDMLYSNILLTGGGSLFPGLKDRLIKEMNKLSNDEYKTAININAPLDRAFGAWIGASMISANNNWTDMWISKEEYTEYGSGIVYRKCLMF